MVSTFFQTCINSRFGNNANKIFTNSLLLQYLEKKTRSVTASSKSRPSLGNLYALYVLIEDYLSKGYDANNNYSKYSGANFSDLFKRQRALPHGSKLQNHALNSRCNEEFKGLFTSSNESPIIRNLDTNKYWINEKLLKITLNGKQINIAKDVIYIIDQYSLQRIQRYRQISEFCTNQRIKPNSVEITKFVKDLLSPTSDARTFEVLSYVILKIFYENQTVFFGYNSKNIRKVKLRLYKTGRTNANDGGIDFVMRPIGRFFQVTEELDFKKFFLDIEKINRFPITFVVKSTEKPKSLLTKIKKQATPNYSKEDLKKYMNSIEDIISIPNLLGYLDYILKPNKIVQLLSDFETYLKVEFDIK